MIKYDVAKYNLIYVYEIKDSQHSGLLKVGQASFSSALSIAQLTPNCPELNQPAHHRIGQQTKTAMVEYNLLYTELAVKSIKMKDGTIQQQAFEDHDVHDVLLASGKVSKKFVESGKPSEWFEITIDDAKAAIKAVKENRPTITAIQIPMAVQPHKAIKLRDEQDRNVRYTIEIFKRYDTMLWDCKMRYGKTVTAYELIKRQGYKKVIVITHRPAVEDSWGSDHDLMFAGTNHQFIDKTRGSMSYDERMDADNDRKLNYLVSSNLPFVYFASIQDLRGSKRVGGKYNKNNGVFDMDWDLLIIDEAHEGTSTDLGDAVIKAIRKDKTKVLSLSGTPYNIMGEFEENKFTWTYVDEQKAKAEWDDKHPGEKNPYEELPKMNIFTFDLSEQIPTSYRYVTEDSAFNFREFFRTWTGDIEKDFRKIPEGRTVGDFVYHDDVYQFLSLISQESETSNYPFSNDEYREMFAHTFWIVPGVKEAKALSAMLKEHPRFKDEFEVVNIAGEGDEEKPYDEALGLVKSSIKAYPKTITISCGKLTTGVTVREWTGVMMLTGSSATAAAGYMQAIFRVQSPGYINGKQKKNCYVFDFAPDRTLKVIAEVHSVTHKSSRGDDKAKQALGEFINFCPVISIEGTQMRTYDVNEMMRQIKRISVDAAINSGFDDDTIYIADAGMDLTDLDINVLRKLSDVVVPQKKGKRKTDVEVNRHNLTDEQRNLAKKAERKPKKDLTPEEQEALELYKKQKEEQKKMFNLLRAVSIRLPLLFYGADADITEIIHLKDFVNIVDDESWEEFMPKGLKQSLFLDILKYYDEDVVVGAGLRIRKMAKAADELPPTLRAKRIVEIMSKFKNPDKETVLTPWRVVNMHMGDMLGGYNFFDEDYIKELEEPRFVEQGDVSANIFLNENAKVLEMNSKSGLYPLYLAYSFYMLNVSGKEKDLPLEEAQKIWFNTLNKHIFVLCKTKMARMITIRTLSGYSKKPIHAIYLTKLIEERMSDLERLSKKLTNPVTWELGGERMKFDCVVGNPPYQLEGGSGGSNDAPIYQDFVLLANAVKPNYSSLIMPARWFAAGRENLLGAFRQFMLSNKSLSSLVTYTDSSNLFSTVEIKGGICYYLMDSTHNGDCRYTIIKNGKKQTMLRDLSRFDILIRDPMLADIVDTVLKNSENKVMVDSIISNDTPFGIASNPRSSKKNPLAVFESSSSEHDVLLYHVENNKRKVEYVRRVDIRKNEQSIEKHKVFVPGSGGSGDDDIVLGKPEYAPPHSVCSQSFLYAEFDTEQEAKNFILYMKTKFFRALVAAIKISQAAPNKVYQFVPLEDLTQVWTDKLLYKKYGLSNEQIDYIEKTFRLLDWE